MLSQHTCRPFALSHMLGPNLGCNPSLLLHDLSVITYLWWALAWGSCSWACSINLEKTGQGFDDMPNDVVTQCEESRILCGCLAW